MGALLSIAAIFDRIARSAGKLAGWLILPLIFIIVFDVVTRKVDVIRLAFSSVSINYGYSVSTILQDLEWHLHGVLLLMTFGFGYLMNAHVRVDIFREHLRRRNQAWLEFWALLLMAAPFLILMLYYSWRFVTISFFQGEGSESMTGIPWRYVVKSFTVFGFAVVLLAVLATLFRLIVYLFGPPDEKEEARTRMTIFAHEDPESRALEEARAATERAAHEARRVRREVRRAERDRRRDGGSD